MIAKKKLRKQVEKENIEILRRSYHFIYEPVTENEASIFQFSLIFQRQK